MEKVYKQCQSCGMPLKMDKHGGGTEKNGTISKKYCSSCYQNGTFARPDFTLEDMQKLVDDILKNEMRRGRFRRRLARTQIATLERRKLKG